MRDNVIALFLYYFPLSLSLSPAGSSKRGAITLSRMNIAGPAGYVGPETYAGIYGGGVIKTRRCRSGFRNLRYGAPPLLSASLSSPSTSVHSLPLYPLKIRAPLTS